MVDTVWTDPTQAYPAGLDRATSQNIPSVLWDQLISNINRLGGADGTTRLGVQKQPNQPAFLAYLVNSAVDVTGNGAVYTIAFNAEIFDKASNFNTGTFTFTAPVAGTYHFDWCAIANDLTAAMTTFVASLVTSNRTYPTTDITTSVASGAKTLFRGVDADMDAGDTAYITLTISGGAGNTANVAGDVIASSFSGHLVG